VPHKYFQIDGVATYVYHLGPTTLPEVVPDLERGELVLCLHGNGDNGAVLQTVMERLAETHSPLVFDQPGHARSGGLDSLGSVDRLAQFTRTFVEKLALRRPVLLGHALGAAIAMQYAADYPDDVRALVLIGAGTDSAVSEEAVEQLRRISEGKERRAFSNAGFSPSASRDVLGRGFREGLKTDPRVHYGDALAWRDWDGEGLLGSIAAPTLVVQGEDEQAERAEQAELLASRIAGARKVSIPGAGSRIALEQPDALAEAVLAFLKGLPQ
jgi:pimeloyl-ACP methyl ester carboxylesterase